MSTDLFKAILAMDSYNRGYGAGIKLSEPVASVGQKIGNTTVIAQSDVADDSTGVNAGFYAIAYQESGGGVTISYRGTDNPGLFDFTSDIWNGWGVGSGSVEGQQAGLAFQFYRTAANANDRVSENTTSHERCAA